MHRTRHDPVQQTLVPHLGPRAHLEVLAQPTRHTTIGANAGMCQLTVALPATQTIKGK
jgi:hypothetical protein